MEVKRERTAPPRQSWHLGVSILVLMEVKRERRRNYPCRRPNRVSILVLMEVKREAEADRSLTDQQRRFNPCFDGSEARDSKAAKSLHRHLSFNPCFDGSEARVSRTSLS